MTSAIDKECLWFCFSKIIQKDFDVLTDHWNSQRIRKSRFETIPGKPNVLYYLQLENPSNYQHALQLFGVLKDVALNGIP